MAVPVGAETVVVTVAVVVAVFNCDRSSRMLLLLMAGPTTAPVRPRAPAMIGERKGAIFSSQVRSLRSASLSVARSSLLHCRCRTSRATCATSYGVS